MSRKVSIAFLAVVMAFGVLGFGAIVWFKVTFAPNQTWREVVNDFEPKDEKFFDPKVHPRH